MHQNLHPSNVVMIKGAPRFININLGIVSEESQHNYLPPEFYQNQPYTTASDIYCLGTLMWQLITGTAPRGKASEKLDELREEFPPIMPEKFQRIIKHCWKLDPYGRPSAIQVCDLLVKCQEEMRTSNLSTETQVFIKKKREEYIEAKLMDAINETIATQDKVKGSLDATHNVDRAEVNKEDEESECVISCGDEIWTPEDIDEILRQIDENPSGA
ncbi:kinase-like domain-containing protein [Endogone sp. FLAS-F59071]|nr:kinase-like domain-containing protein [Endogone sp. FLAS-F59071]|eukprot:RUS18833.1 kinase-like domain-containing protein [Endogone sp. FLAS-F59071]